MPDPSAPAGRVVAIRAKGETPASTYWLERGPLAVSVVLERVPILDLPPGARLRIGRAAIVELRPHASGQLAGFDTNGILEGDAAPAVPGEILEEGPIAVGDAVTLEAVSVALTDVLDLHSFQPAEMPRLVTEYLGAARRAGLGEVRIVHGRGAGVQRAMVRRLLADAPGVAGFTDAPPTRGGWGATVVHLRTEDVPPE